MQFELSRARIQSLTFSPYDLDVRIDQCVHHMVMKTMSAVQYKRSGLHQRSRNLLVVLKAFAFFFRTIGVYE
ncbi:hypothetical protein M441DRAFT_283907 [Trichoderma asperellum CBS 433.97]|uniref:Uncharacterized protein n=1 Tax=Trichoderma asperellum (strain ATCC 204424 / CBS 433.97 / NBRC 101777) TaxID=1042311 RepID=A0A2T3YUB2_TRIA4|nr:hypothetical protein M441DRAFT_283907 [Trichoderma asperellum CBS 433.97]PTB36163.1 hypothetical protein M441DRAFT_283907 [Trichoderma asperellum CBS 433.97]